MQLVLLSGGSGKRLWPLSNDSRSKQFLKVLRDDQGRLESMVQRVWRQLRAVGLAQSAHIATGRAQVEMIQNQLGMDVPIIVEPVRRDTFPAIALACSYLATQEQVDPNETVAVLPVDPYVEQRFFAHVKKLEDVLRDSSAELALMGVKPTFPSMKYGYMIPAEPAQGQDYLRILRFKEKPSEEEAKQLIAQGALWNCGVFAFRLGSLLSRLEKAGYPTNYHELLDTYHRLPKISFDYEVVEKTEQIVALPYDGDWKDLGTWNTLTEEMGTSIIGEGSISADSRNTHLINELGLPIHVLNISNAVIAASPDGILVSEKSASPRIKELVAESTQRPMYEERRWGWYRVLDFDQEAEEHEVLTRHVYLQAEKNLSYHRHNQRKEVWTIISGEGELILAGKKQTVKAGDVVQIPPGTLHALLALSDMEIIEVQMGQTVSDSDIERVCMEWEDALRHVIFV